MDQVFPPRIIKLLEYCLDLPGRCQQYFFWDPRLAAPDDEIDHCSADWRVGDRGPTERQAAVIIFLTNHIVGRLLLHATDEVVEFDNYGNALKRIDRDVNSKG